MRLLKVKCPIICRQIFLYLFVSRLVRVKRWNPKNILNSFISYLFFLFLFFFFFVFFFYPPFSVLAYEMLNQCTKSSNTITIFIQFNKIYKPYFVVLTLCSDMQFSTRNSDNDIKPNSSCAQKYKGAWWYSDCHRSNLNGLYLSGSHSSMAHGVNWIPFRGYQYSLKRTEMKVKQISVVISFLFSFDFSRRDYLGPDHGHNTLQLSILFFPVSRRIFYLH